MRKTLYARFLLIVDLSQQHHLLAKVRYARARAQREAIVTLGATRSCRAADAAAHAAATATAAAAAVDAVAGALRNAALGVGNRR